MMDVSTESEESSRRPVVHEITEDRVREAIALRFRSRHELSAACKAFKEIVDSTPLPQVHISSHVLSKVPPVIAVQTIIAEAGLHSAVVSALKAIIGERDWKNAYLELVDKDYGWYEIRDVFYDASGERARVHRQRRKLTFKELFNKYYNQ